MNSRLFFSVSATILLSGVLLIPSAKAQYTGDNQTNFISGVVSNWSNDYVVGAPTGNQSAFDALFIQDGGVLSNGDGYVGPDNGNNFVMVSGTGSSWNNSGDCSIGGSSDFDELIITNAGAVYDNNGFLGFISPYDFGGHSVLVTGSGSVWSNRNDLSIASGGGNTFTVADGARVFNDNATIDAEQAALVVVTDADSMWSINGNLKMVADYSMMVITNGAVVHSESATVRGSGFSTIVTGPGSVWTVTSNLAITGDFADTLDIADGGAVYVYGSATLSADGSITISGGALYITNAFATAILSIGDGDFTLNDGSVTVDQLTTTDPQSSSTVFNSGVLRTKATTINDPSVFIVGDGMNLATFILDSGGSGIHSFANGLAISSNALLTGCGTIDGSVVIDPGGKVLTSCGGKLTFSGIVTNNGIMRATHGNVFESYGTFVNNGRIRGPLDFHGTLVDHGTVLAAQGTNISAIIVLGKNVLVRVPSVRGYIYQLEVSTSPTATNWKKIGIPKYGTGRLLTLIDCGGARIGRNRLYRVVIARL